MQGRGGDYSPEYIEVEEPDEPVPTQDSCLQVTEEDIAFSMMEALEAKCNDIRSLSSFTDGEEHPLRALSHDNLTIISHFTGETYSQGTASEWEPIGSSIFDPMPSSSVMDNTEFYQTQLEQLAKLHQQIYQQSIAGNTAGTLHPTPLSALTNCNIGSFKVRHLDLKKTLSH
jgi:kinesin family protein 26